MERPWTGLGRREKRSPTGMRRKMELPWAKPRSTSTPVGRPSSPLMANIPADRMKRFSWPIRVYYEDTDASGVVYHASYLRFLERARTEFLRHLGFEQRRLKRERAILFAVRRMAVDFLEPAHFDDLLLATAAVSEMGRVRIRFQQELLRGERPICKAEVEVVSLDRDRFRPTPIPPPIREALGRWLSS